MQFFVVSCEKICSRILERLFFVELDESITIHEVKLRDSKIEMEGNFIILFGLKLVRKLNENKLLLSVACF